ncbi:MAG TPA: hypothetical protein VFM06_11820 [Candidatus Limnocylindria bacterium]|nr:hypothetical protein [Candidatus Limnocylindria bacterium]
MTGIGALAAMLAAIFGVLALHAPSPVLRRLDALGPRGAREPRTWRHGDHSLVVARAGGALAGAFVGSLVSLALPVGPFPVLIGAYAGAMVPAIAADRRSRRDRRAAQRATLMLVEWLHALVGCGRPLEAALVTVAERPSGSVHLDGVLARVRRDYTLGVPLRDALVREGTSADLPGVIEIARRLERARDLGRGALPLLTDLRDELRASERAQALQAASHVEGKLTLILTLCYLPALALLVIIPLFLTLLAGLFG